MPARSRQPPIQVELLSHCRMGMLAKCNQVPRNKQTDRFDQNKYI